MHILIIDDDKLVCNALKTIVEANNITVDSIGFNCLDAISLYGKFKPDILLMDIRMGEKTGIDAAEEILKSDNNAKILFLTTFEDEEYIIKALKLGAKGYLLKQDFENIVPALNAVYSGQSVFGEKIVDKLPHLLTGSNNIAKEEFNISTKELEIITLLSEGLSNREIADKLAFSEGTIRNYISNITEKLGFKSRTQLVAFYYNNLR